MTQYYLGNDVNFLGTTIRAGKLIDDRLYDVVKLTAAGAALYPVNGATAARAAVLQALNRSGQRSTLDIGGRYDALVGLATTGSGGPLNVALLNTAAPFAAQSGQVIICDTSTASLTIDLPTFGAGQWVLVVHAKGSLAVNSVSVVATSPQQLAQPAQNPSSALVGTYIIGGGSSTSGQGANDAGVALTWTNGGIPNVLSLV